jgi:SAM-dependent methyltransferase
MAGQRGAVNNTYSPEWYETFADSIPSTATALECAFVERHLPPALFPALLDLCCGPGRHAAVLSRRGYRVVGVDANERAIELARNRCPGASFVACDMRSLDSLAGSFDGVVNLWHSFGYFDDDANRDVLRQVHAVLRPGGRAIFDIFNRDHFENRPAEEIRERGGRQIRTRRTWRGSRHRVTLEYDGIPGDHFDWRLYSPAEFREQCALAGLEMRLACACFDEAAPPSAEHARMQFVVQRAA